VRRNENSSCLITSEDMKKTYAMAESEAYFEAYRHVLAGLQGDTIIFHLHCLRGPHLNEYCINDNLKRIGKAP